MDVIKLKKVFAALPVAVRGTSVKLSGDPKGKNFLYCNGLSVYIRNMEDPCQVDIYTEHAKEATVARYAPSGFYIASCDVTGKVRIWDTINPEHILKAEYQMLSGRINDIDWSPDSKRIVVCGEGREKFAAAFIMDTGTSVGEIGGHSKAINTCSYRPERPYRIVTASEDLLLGFHEGPPFKFSRTQGLHTNFVNVARFSRNGQVVLSGGQDGQLIKYCGKSLDEPCQIIDLSPKDEQVKAPAKKDAAHTGGIYDLCFSPDNTKVLTAGGDHKAKVFEVESGNLVKTFTCETATGDDWENQLLGCLWQGEEIITVNACGHITYHNYDDGKPKRVIKGHMKPAMCLAVASTQKFFTGGLDGIFCWDADSGNAKEVEGHRKGTKSARFDVIDMVVDGDNLISVTSDDMLRIFSVSECKSSDGELKLDSQPKALAALNGTMVVACVNHVMVLEGSRKLSSCQEKSEARCVSIHPGGSVVAVGFEDSNVKIYSLECGALKEEKKWDMEKGAIDAVAFSPDGAYLCVAAHKHIRVCNTTDYEVIRKEDPHDARIRSVAWSPDSSRYISSGIDNKLVVSKDISCAQKSTSSKASIKAFPKSHANQVAWLDQNTVVACGQDGNIKQLTVTY